MKNGRERRAAERVVANLFLEIVNPYLKESMGRGVVVDVSLSGFAIETETDLSINDEVDCYIEIPYTVRAQVVRRISSGQIKKYGLKILKQGFFDKLLLKKVLKGKLYTQKVKIG